MAWNNRENNLQNPNDQTPIIDRCINCGKHEQVHSQIKMEQEGSLLFIIRKLFIGSKAIIKSSVD